MKLETTPVKFGIEGKIKLEVFDAEGNEIVEKRVPEFTNAVTYEGAEYLFFPTSTSPTTPLGTNLYCRIGTGTQEIVRDSSGLGQDFGVSSGSSGSVDPRANEIDNGDGTSSLSIVRVMNFSLGGTVGTFSEVGLYSSTTVNSTFVAGQLIKDELGNPTTVTVFSDEQLRVTYTLEVTVPNTAHLVGEGTLEGPSGPFGYKVYAQRYFTNSGSTTSTVCSYGTASSGTGVHRYFNKDTGASFSMGTGTSSSVQFLGEGLVRFRNRQNVWPPSSFTASNFGGYFYTRFGNITGTANIDVETGNSLSTNGQVTTVVVFDENLSKSNEESLQISCHIDVQV